MQRDSLYAAALAAGLLAGSATFALSQDTAVTPVAPVQDVDDDDFDWGWLGLLGLLGLAGLAGRKRDRHHSTTVRSHPVDPNVPPRL